LVYNSKNLIIVKDIEFYTKLQAKIIFKTSMNYLTPNNQKDDTFEEVRSMVNSFKKSRIILSAFELDIFSFIANKKKSALDIAKLAESDIRATEIILDALCAIKLLGKDEGLYYNTPLASRYLDKASGDYISGFQHSVHLWDSWTGLTGVLREGILNIEPKVKDRSKKWLEAFIQAMHDRANKNANHLISNLDLTNTTTVLDLGGGPGTYAMAFIKAKEDIKAWVFDLPSVIPLTKKYIRIEGYTDNIETIKGFRQATVDEIARSAKFRVSTCNTGLCYG